MFLIHEVVVVFFFYMQDEVEPMQQIKTAGTIPDMEKALAAKTQVVEELTQELEEIRAAFGTEGVQQVNVLIKWVYLLLFIHSSVFFNVWKCINTYIHIILNSYHLLALIIRINVPCLVAGL